MSPADVKYWLSQGKTAVRDYYHPTPVLRDFMWKRDDKALPLRCVMEYVDNGDEQYWVVNEAWAGEHNVIDLLDDDQLVRVSDAALAAFRNEDEQINAERRAEFLPWRGLRRAA